jgi:hypothetical protein
VTPAGLLALDLMGLDASVGPSKAKLDALPFVPDGLQFDPNGLPAQEPDELTDGPPQLVAVADLVRIAAG